MPAGTPPANVARLNRELVRAVGVVEVRERVAGLGGDIAGSTAGEFQRHIRDEIAKWARVIKTAGLRSDAVK